MNLVRGIILIASSYVRQNSFMYFCAAVAPDPGDAAAQDWRSLTGHGMLRLLPSARIAYAAAADHDAASLPPIVTITWRGRLAASQAVPVLPCTSGMRAWRLLSNFCARYEEMTRVQHDIFRRSVNLAHKPVTSDNEY